MILSPIWTPARIAAPSTTQNTESELLWSCVWACYYWGLRADMVSVRHLVVMDKVKVRARACIMSMTLTSIGQTCLCTCVSLTYLLLPAAQTPGCLHLQSARSHFHLSGLSHTAGQDLNTHTKATNGVRWSNFMVCLCFCPKTPHIVINVLLCFVREAFGKIEVSWIKLFSITHQKRFSYPTYMRIILHFTYCHGFGFSLLFPV